MSKPKNSARRPLIASIIVSAAVSFAVVFGMQAAARPRVQQTETNAAASPSSCGPIVTQLAPDAPELASPKAASASPRANAGAGVTPARKGHASAPKAGDHDWSTAFAD